MTTETMIPEYLVPAEVAKKLRVSKDTVYRLLADGRLRGVRRGEGGGWLVPVEAIEEYLKRPRGPAVTPPSEAARTKKEQEAREELKRRGYRV